MAAEPKASSHWQACFDRDGFAIIDRVLTKVEVSELIELTRVCSSTADTGVLDRGGEVYGVRDLIWRIPEIRRLAHARTVLEIAQAILGPDAFVVRGAVFRQDAKHQLESAVAPGHDDCHASATRRIRFRPLDE